MLRPGRPRILGELDFVIDIGRVLVALADADAGRGHLRRQRRVVLGYLAPLVPAERVSAEIRVRRVEGRLGLFGLLGRGLGAPSVLVQLLPHRMALATPGSRPLTWIKAQTNSSGSP